jgi:transcriptional regulator with XRE-family HTH domain
VTNQEMRRLAHSEDLAAIRQECGITAARIAEALGVLPGVVYQYERGTRKPNGQLGARYMRIMVALRNHLEVPADDELAEGEHADA